MTDGFVLLVCISNNYWYFSKGSPPPLLFITLQRSLRVTAGVGIQGWENIHTTVGIRAVDPHSFSADPDPAAFLIRFRIQL